MIRIRIHYHKNDPIRFTGNLDLHKIWERAFRRAQIPIAYSQGFHPQPRLNQACPLPLGLTSTCEIVDAWIQQDEMDMSDLQKRLAAALPAGLDITGAEEIPLSSPPVQTMVYSSEYNAVCVNEIPEDLGIKIDQLLKSETRLRLRRDKKYDIRPLIESMEISELQPVTIRMILAAGPQATGRPDEVLAELGIDPNHCQVQRTALHLREK